MRLNKGFTPLEKINNFNKKHLSPALTVKKYRSLTGFTLVELMVTVIIIGILVGITVPGIKRQQETAKCSQAMNNLRTMRTAAFEYYTQNTGINPPVPRLTFIGMTITGGPTSLATLANANFTNTPDWNYTLSNLTVSTFTITAARRRGPWWAAARPNITLNQDNAWNNPAIGYPWNNPGGF